MAGTVARSGVRDVLIYAAITAAAITSKPTLTVRLSGIEPSFTCTHCGKTGAVVRPRFSHARMGTG